MRRCIVLYAFINILTSCISDLPINSQYVDLPVVNCILTNNKYQKLTLSKSLKMGDWFVFEEITEADIILYANNIPVGSFIRKGYMDWELEYRPIPGVEYMLEIKLPDGNILVGKTTMPDKCDIRKSVVDNVQNRIKYFKQFTSQSPLWIFILDSDKFVKPNEANPLTQKVVLRDYLGVSHIMRDKFNENGLLTELIAESKLMAHKYYIRIEAFEQRDAAIEFYIESNYKEYNFVCFRTSSIEYDKYLKSSYKKMLSYNTIDPSLWFDETVIYSNIQNGIGIFAAYYDDCFASIEFL